MTFFENRKLIIATKHGKDEVMRPLLSKHLGTAIFVPTDFDTDAFGTFSGEIPRPSDALTTVRNKCLAAMNHYGYDLGIASEGSFGTHPSYFFAQADDEVLIFIDQKNKLEIVARELSLSTNFSTATITSWQELVVFAEQVGFPDHGLLFKATATGPSNWGKDILDWETLQSFYTTFSMASQHVVWVETDMRAHRNPTRMQVIEKATQNLIQKISTLCPNCQTPGFDVTKVITGLPCQWCASPTESTLALHYACQKCNHSNLEKFPKGKTHESPEYCSYCNP